MVSVKNNLKVQRTPVETGTVDLSISGPHARTLIMVLSRVGGGREDSARGYAQDILDDLLDVLKWTYPYEDSEAGATGSIYFTEKSRAVVEEVK